MIFKAQFEINITSSNIQLSIIDQTYKPMLILPEIIGKQYLKSITDILNIWKLWSADYKIINAGLSFEIYVIKFFQSEILAKVFWEYCRRFIYKFCSNSIWKEFLEYFSRTEEAGCAIVSIENDGSIEFTNHTRYIESLAIR